MVKLVSNLNAVSGSGLSTRLAGLTANRFGSGIDFWKGKNEDSSK